MEQNQMNTGTTTIGIQCKDGVVLAADKRATAGNFIANKKAQKIHQVAEKIGVTIAGTVSDAQLLVKLIRAELKLKQLRTGRTEKVKEAANLLGGMVYNNIRRMSMIPGITHFVLAGHDNEGTKIFDIYADGSVTEIDDYYSSGSGSVMAFGVLDTQYKRDMSLQEGIELAKKAVSAALQRDSASGEGIDIVTITKDGYKSVFHKDLKPVI